ncbi:MAG: hypothetical protein ACFFA0_04205 [Promethearchaeota archaeon]
MKKYSTNRLRVRATGLFWIHFFFRSDQNAIPLIYSLITRRRKELELEFPEKRERKNFIKKRNKRLAKYG